LPGCLGTVTLLCRRPGPFWGTGGRYSKPYKLISRGRR
jgi:hypothetical protein